MLIDLIAGARPNFMKIAPIIHILDKGRFKDLKYRLIHTGQHFDRNMSEVFFEQLGIPEPHINLEAGGGTQAEQIGKIMVRYEELLTNSPSDLCVVVGDVNSTLACSITAKKMMIKVAHIEAGIRSGDLNMPEEINRIVTDSISDYFFTTSLNANDNLLKLGALRKNIFFVGNTMIDSLINNMNNFIKPNFWDRYNIKNNQYFVLTLHRPSNVDNEDNLITLLKTIVDNSKDFNIIFPVHPRTKRKLSNVNLNFKNLILTNPLSYLEFNYLVKNAKAVITDSGGISEETTFMNVPCITLRNSTERPETIEIGTNELVGTDPDKIKLAMLKIVSGNWKKGSVPKFWDGLTSERIVSHISNFVL